MINFLQTTAVAASLDLDWSDGMNGLFETSEYIGALSTSLVSRPSDCLASSATKVTRFVWRMLLSIFVPTFVILTITTFWAFMALTNGESVSYFGKRTILSAIAVTYISYLGLTKMGVRAFYCVGVYDYDDPSVDSKNQYLASDTSIECYKKEHLSLIAIGVIVLVVVTVAFPLVSGVVLSKNKQRHMRKDGWMFETAGFLFRAFKESCLFWESLVMFRKACLSVIVVFSYSLGGLPQIVLAQLVLLTSLYIHVMIRPYRKEFEKLNTLESVSLLVSCLTFTLGLFFESNRSSGSVRAFLSIVIIVLNTLFFISLLFALIKSGIGHIRVVLQYENAARYDQVPWWRLLKIFAIARCRSLLKLSS